MALAARVACPYRRTLVDAHAAAYTRAPLGWHPSSPQASRSAGRLQLSYVRFGRTTALRPPSGRRWCVHPLDPPRLQIEKHKLPVGMCVADACSSATPDRDRREEHRKNQGPQAPLRCSLSREEPSKASTATGSSARGVRRSRCTRGDELRTHVPPWKTARATCPWCRVDHRRAP